jgi:hypothetical protein
MDIQLVYYEIERFKGKKLNDYYRNLKNAILLEKQISENVCFYAFV